VSHDLWALGGRLIGNAIVQRRAQETADRERIAASPRASSFRPVEPPLPVEHVHDGAHCRFGYPWGWAEVDSGSISGGATEPGTEPVLALQPERYDGDGSYLRIIAIGGCSTEDLLDMAAVVEDQRARDLGLEPWAPLGFLEVAGEPALIVQLHGRAGPAAPGPVVLTEVFTAHRGRAYQVQLLSGEGDHPAYQQVLWTVAGTWGWAR
jgi:hypothetical protein